MRRQSGQSTSSQALRKKAAHLRPNALAWSLAIAFAAAPLALQANPTGGVAVSGSMTTSTTGTAMTVTTTNGANSTSVINWNSFSIPQGSSTNFVQPNAASTSVNRVVTNTPSQIFGTLSSNGKLVLVNQSGITVGAGAVVDTAGFTASVLGMSEADAIAGRMRFAADNLGNATGKLQVDGKIIARTGDVVLIAPSVELARTAIVEAPNGSAILVAGQKVEITGRGLEGISLQVQAPTDSAVNLGTLKADAVGIFAMNLRHSGLIQANGVTVDGGRVILKATDTAQVDGRIEATKVVSTPSGPQTVGGDVSIDGRIVTVSGAVQATGATGGTINVTGYSVSQGGLLNASGTLRGGTVKVIAENYAEQISGAKIDVSSTDGQGGSALVQATGDQGEIISSGTIVADGASGGTVEMYAPTIYLQNAKISADGIAASAGDGGNIYLGGGKHGDDPLKPNSRYLVINSTSTISARSRRKGQGGTVILWSDGTTRFSGNINARGGEEGGDGGFIEVSGKESVVFRGMVNAGATNGHGGTLLLDPKNITIEDGGSSAMGLDPDHESVGTGAFGDTMELWGGKLVITDPLNDSNATDAGAVYIFDPATGALLGALRGSHANDFVGGNIGLNPINNNELLLMNGGWNAGVGAITLYSLAAPYTGIVSSANSFVGQTAGDSVGNYGYTIIYGAGGVRELLFQSPNWGGDKGAIIRLSATGGVRSGVVDSTTALVGAYSGDRLGDFGEDNTYVTAYNNNTYLLLTRDWNGGAGAVTRGVVGSTLTGVVGASNSLVGTLSSDAVGSNGAILNTDGSYVVFSPNWNLNAGGVTWGGTGGVVGALDATAGTGNTLTGNAGSMYGSNHVQLTGGKFVVLAPTWTDNVGTPNKGAFTVLSTTTKTAGSVSAANSVVGSNTGDYVSCNVIGSCSSNGGAVATYGDDWYSVASINWDGQHGAITFFYTGTNSVANNAAAKTPKGVISGSSTSNLSVVGYYGTGEAASGSVGDRVGYYGADYNYGSGGQFAVRVPEYNDARGAIMVLDASSMTGSTTLSDSNSIHGTVGLTDASSYSVPPDRVGDFYGNYNFWAGSNYILIDPNWNYGRGVVASLSTGQNGALSSTNALVGTAGADNSAISDQVGSGLVSRLYNGQLLISSPHWNDDSGAVSIRNTNAITGVITSGNSMVGQTAGDMFGPTSSDQVLDLSYSGTVITLTPGWRNDRGAITWITLASPNGTVSSSTNSLVGASVGDRIGSGGFVGPDAQYGNYLPYDMVSSPNFGDDGEGTLGAITRVGTTAAPGVVSSSNSLVGANYGDAIQINCYSYDSCSNAYTFGNGAWILSSYINNGNDYAFTVFVPGASPVGTVDASNSIIESSSWTNGYLMTDANGGGNGLGDKAVLYMQYWGGDKGAIRVIDTNSVATGATDNTNALVGNSGDYLGSDGGEGLFVHAHDGGRMIIFSPHWGGDKGAVTVLDTQTSPYIGTLSAGNSLVGNNGDDFGGYSGSSEDLQYRGFSNGNFVMFNRFYDGGQGSVTYFDLSAIPVGAIDSTNSLLGNAGPIEGFNAFGVNGSAWVISAPTWNNNRGFAALYTEDGTSRPTGIVDSSNALIGVNDGDMVGDRVFDIGNGKFVVASQYWGGGEGVNRGALTWGTTGSSLTGVVDATTSLVGAYDNDYLGAGFGEGGYSSPIAQLGGTSTYYLLMSDYHGGNGGIAFVEYGATGSINNQTVLESETSNGVVGPYYNTPLDLGTGWYAVRMGGDYQGSGPGQVFFTQAIPGGSAGGGAGLPQNFETNPGDDVTITTGTIKAITDNGTGIVLQANNDININGDIVTVGSLTFEAGRSIDINANITNSGGLTFIANHTLADYSYRDSGAGEIRVEAGKTVNFGSGNATFRVDGGESSGDIYVYGVVTGSGTLNIDTPNYLSIYGYSGPARVQGGNVNINASTLDIYGANYGATLLATGNLNVTADNVYVSADEAGSYAQIVVVGNATFNVSNGIEVSTNDEGSGGFASMAVLGNLNINSSYLNIHGSGITGTATVVAGSFDYTGGEAAVTADYGGSATLTVAGAMNMNASSFTISGDSGVASVTAGSANISVDDFGIYAGLNSASMSVTGAMNISATNYIAINGGFGAGAYASLKSGGSAVISTDTLSISGGSGNGAYGLLDPTNLGSTMTITANQIYLDGGEGAGSYAALVSQGGNMNFQGTLPTIYFNPGTGVGSDAVIYAPNGEELAALFSIPYLGDENPLTNNLTQYGFAKYKLPINYEQNDLLSGLDWLNDLLNPDDRRRRRGDDIVFDICAR